MELVEHGDTVDISIRVMWSSHGFWKVLRVFLWDRDDSIPGRRQSLPHLIRSVCWWTAVVFVGLKCDAARIHNCASSTQHARLIHKNSRTAVHGTHDQARICPRPAQC